MDLWYFFLPPPRMKELKLGITMRANQPHFTVDPGWPPHGEDSPIPGRPWRIARFPDELRQQTLRRQLLPHKKAKPSEPLPGWSKTLAAFKKQQKRKSH